MQLMLRQLHRARADVVVQQVGLGVRRPGRCLGIPQRNKQGDRTYTGGHLTCTVAARGRDVATCSGGGRAAVWQLARVWAGAVWAVTLACNCVAVRGGRHLRRRLGQCELARAHSVFPGVE